MQIVCRRHTANLHNVECSVQYCVIRFLPALLDPLSRDMQLLLFNGDVDLVVTVASAATFLLYLVDMKVNVIMRMRNYIN